MGARFEVRRALEDAILSGIGEVMLQIAFSDSGMIAAANSTAEAYARERVAELVGMKYRDDGLLVTNPDARWAISDTTRDRLRIIVADAFKQEIHIADISTSIQSALADQAEGNGIFSEALADMIAATEISRAQVSGNYEVWRQSGVVLKLKWLILADHNEEDECDLNEDVEVKFGELFPSGNLHPPLHPHCKCAVAVAEVVE
jgi:hypothetical protein